MVQLFIIYLTQKSGCLPEVLKAKIYWLLVEKELEYK